MRSKRAKTDEPAVNAVKIAKPSPPRTAGSLKHLTGYVDAARAGGLAFGDDRVPVKYPDNVYIIDDAIEAVKTAETCVVCEDPTCTTKATHGVKHSRGAPRR